MHSKHSTNIPVNSTNGWTVRLAAVTKIPFDLSLTQVEWGEVFLLRPQRIILTVLFKSRPIGLGGKLNLRVVTKCWYSLHSTGAVTIVLYGWWCVQGREWAFPIMTWKKKKRKQKFIDSYNWKRNKSSSRKSLRNHCFKTWKEVHPSWDFLPSICLSLYSLCAGLILSFCRWHSLSTSQGTPCWPP